MFMKLALLAIATPVAVVHSSIVSAGSISLTDVATSISGLQTIFVDNEIAVTADGLEWIASEAINDTNDTLVYETLVDGNIVATGSVSLTDVDQELPTSIDAGTISIPNKGRYTIEVVLTIGDSEASTSSQFEAYGAGVAIIPLLVVLTLAICTNMVRCCHQNIAYHIWCMKSS